MSFYLLLNMNTKGCTRPYDKGKCQISVGSGSVGFANKLPQSWFGFAAKLISYFTSTEIVKFKQNLSLRSNHTLKCHVGLNLNFAHTEKIRFVMILREAMLHNNFF